MFEALLTDVRFAARWLRKSPAFTLVAVLSFAIGIGLNTALFAIIDAVLFRPLPVAGEDRLVDVFTSAGNGDRYSTVSYPDFADLKAQNAVFDDMIGYSPMFGALSLGDRSRLVLGEIVTGNYFRMLGVGAALGRTLLPEDDGPGAPRVVTVSYRYWTRELGADPGAVGRPLKLRGSPYTIVGVAPRWFSGMTPALSPELWVPMSAAMDIEPVGLRDVVPSPTGTTRFDRRGERWMFVRGRLKPGVTAEQAGANLDVLMAGLASANPATNKDRHFAVKPTRDVRFHPAADPVVVPIATGLIAAVGLVLLIACANVASMLLTRASGRRKEIGIRLAIGASRGRLVQQLLTESLVLSALGALAGVWLAWWIMRAVESLSLPIPLPLTFDLRLDARALIFTLGATLTAGVLAGLAPAFRALKPNLVRDLRGEATVSSVGGGRWTLGDGLVAAQMAITTLLLIVAALLTRSLMAAERVSVGFAVDGLAFVSMDVSTLPYSEERASGFFDQALTRVRAIPGVESAALSSRVPFSVNFNRWDIWVPRRQGSGDRTDSIEVTHVSLEYFATLGVPILQGRAFTSGDGPGTPRVAIVNETMARRYWPGESAVGKTFRTRGPDGALFEVVGVAADHKVATLGEPPTPFIHLARAQQAGTYAALVARTRGEAALLLRNMRRELLALEPDLVFFESQTMAAEVAATLFPMRAGSWMVGTVGAFAMLLAAIGLYGVISYSVARRTREIGIRLALGADPASVLRLVMGRGLTIAAVGLAGGAILAAFVAKAMAGALYGIGVRDPLSWGSAATVLLGASALANMIPARRAARVNPADALRAE